MSYMNNRRHRRQYKVWDYYEWSWTNDPERYVIYEHLTKKDQMRKNTEGYKRYIIESIKKLKK